MAKTIELLYLIFSVVTLIVLVRLLPVAWRGFTKS